MAENTIERKFFLDWEGVKTLWNKINSTFANKAAVDETLTTITNDLTTVGAEVNALDKSVNLRIDGVEGTIETFMPKEFPTYTDAVRYAPALAPGTVIKILNDGPLLNELDEPVKDNNGTTPVYKAGLYIIVDPINGVIQKISTASGAGDASNVEELSSVVQQLSADVVKTAIIVTETGEVLSTVEKTDNSLLIKVDDTFVVDSQSANMLSHRAVAAMYGELANQISQIPKFKISVVDELPTTSISASTIYLVKNSDPTSNNIYTEFIYVKNDDKDWHWEKLGEQSLTIDDFAKKSDVEEMITIAMHNVVKIDTLNDALAVSKAEILDEVSKNYISKLDVEKFIDEEELNNALSDYYSKAEADDKFVNITYANETYLTDDDIKDFMTEPEIITSIMTGNIGTEIRITDELINSLTE